MMHDGSIARVRPHAQKLVWARGARMPVGSEARHIPLNVEWEYSDHVFTNRARSLGR